MVATQLLMPVSTLLVWGSGPPLEDVGTMLVVMMLVPMPLVVRPPRFSQIRFRTPLGLMRWKTKSDTRGWSTRKPTSTEKILLSLVTVRLEVLTASSAMARGPAEWNGLGTTVLGSP